NYLHDQVCSGAMTLAEAQRLIAINWLAVYNSLAPGAESTPVATRIQVTATRPPAQPTATRAQQVPPTATRPPAPTAAPTQSGARVRIGATCNDGINSNATGSGACSHHGGVRCWRYSDGSCTKP